MTRKNNFIQALKDGQAVSDIFAIAQAQRKEAKNGPYWQLSLSDRTGSIEARIWFPQSQQFESLKAEQFVAVTGQVASFKDQLQMNVSDLVLVDPVDAGLDLTDFLPSSSTPPAELLQELEDFLAAELSFKPWQTLCKNVLTDERIRNSLLSAPGAKAIHHAYAGGLLEHVLGIMRICRALAALYPQIDKEILLVGALFHDLGKAFELSHGISREYTDEGRLLGHISIGLEALEPFLRKTKNLPPELALHLKHLIISHHGEYEFGSPRRPKTLEAFVLHYADNLDAKINTVKAALTGPDGEDMHGWSEYQRSLSRYLYQPMRTPKTEKSESEHKLAKKSAPKPEPSALLKAMGFTGENS